jgi:chromate transporter
MAELLELVLRFLAVGALAFGGGASALPLVERFTVAETGWLTPRQFAIGVGFAYATPGPILILAAFVGYYVAGVPGALAGTAAVFAVPVILAAGSADIVQRLSRYAGFRAFARFAAAGAVGLLAVTLTALARPLVETHPMLLIGAAVVFAGERSGFSPVLLLLLAALGGMASAFVLSNS